MNSWKISAFAFVVVCLAFTQARNIKLETSDGETIGVDIKVANVSGYIAGMLESLNLEENDDEITVSLANVNAKVLRHVLVWAENNKDDREIPDDKRTNTISAWDQNFLDELKQDELFDVILAANFLDIRGLLDVSTQNVANMMKGKSPEQLRLLFGITDDKDQA